MGILETAREQIQKLAKQAGERAASRALLRGESIQTANESELSKRAEVSARLLESLDNLETLPPLAFDLPLVQDERRDTPPIITVY